jgi:hypothetical protein
VGDPVTRTNPDLDDVFDPPEPGTRRAGRVNRQGGKRRKPLQKDHVRRLAFRVLALLSGHDEATRARVLSHAAKLNKG